MSDLDQRLRMVFALALDMCGGHQNSDELRTEVRKTRRMLNQKLRSESECSFGARCEEHGGIVHGQEAEELRRGVERLIETETVRSLGALYISKKSLEKLLERVDARDSLAFVEKDVEKDARNKKRRARSKRR